MHYSPRVPILQSYDLVNMQYIGHSGVFHNTFEIFQCIKSPILVPVLDWSSTYDLTDGQRAYIKGIPHTSILHPQLRVPGPNVRLSIIAIMMLDRWLMTMIDPIYRYTIHLITEK